MAWPPTSEDKAQAFKEDGTWFENRYDCSECGEHWTDNWSCTSDDDCPKCGTTCSPSESEEIEFDG
jgi:hypothetical protein